MDIEDASVEELKALVEELQSDNTELQRTVERERDFSKADTGGIKAVATKYQRERDEAVQNLDTLANDYEKLRELFLALRREHEVSEDVHNAFVKGVAGRYIAITKGALPADVHEVFRLGVVNHLTQQLVFVKQERDRLRDLLQSIDHALFDGLRSIAEEAEQERQTLFEKAALLENVKQEGGLTYIADSWLNLLDYYEKLDSEELEEINSEEANKIHGEVIQELIRRVRTMMFLARGAERAHLSSEILDAAIILADDPRIVAYDILTELKTTGLSMTTVKKLSEDWVSGKLKPNLSGRTLKKGLETAYKWHSEGRPTQTVFAGLNNIPDRTLRDYIHWFEVIEATAESRNTKFAAFLPDRDEEV